jgi:hypothetical protein
MRRSPVNIGGVDLGTPGGSPRLVDVQWLFQIFFTQIHNFFKRGTYAFIKPLAQQNHWRLNKKQIPESARSTGRSRDPP